MCLVAVLGAASGGCVAPGQSSPAIAGSLPAHQSADLLADKHDAPTDEPLTLESLIGIAKNRRPEVAAAQASAEAARGKLIQAGLYPNPVIGPQWNEIGHRDNAAGEIGLGMSFPIVTANKLAIAQAAAAHGVAAADWHALTRWYDVLTQVRSAFYEYLGARREVETTEDIVRVAERAVDAAKALQKAGAGSQPDVLRAQVEAEQSRLRRENAQQRLNAAKRLLAAAVGVPSLPDAPVVGSLEAQPPSYDWSKVRALVLARSAEVQEAQARVAEAEELLRRAGIEPVPNLQIWGFPHYSGVDRDWRGEFGVAVAVPLFNRNQGNVLAAQAELDRTRFQVRAVELALTERLAQALQRFEIARQQTEAFRKRILPQARESLRLVEIGYKGGDAKYDFTALLQAQQILFQAQLSYVQALADVWRADSAIRGLLQED